jgi:hypothetical protein
MPRYRLSFSLIIQYPAITDDLLVAPYDSGRALDGSEIEIEIESGRRRDRK